MIENWKDVKGYEGVYIASDLGRVKKIVNGVKSIVSQYENHKGYLICSIRKVGNSKSLGVHQLVAMAFLNHTPCGHGVIVDHIDNNPSNNNLSNIQLISNRENCSKDQKIGTSKYVGVRWHKHNKAWTSQIRVGKKRKTLGYFSNEIDAHNAYQKELNLITV